MSTAVATAERTEIAPTKFLNPLTIDTTAAAVARLDDLVTGFIDEATGHVEDEMRRMMRRREVSAAVRGILQAKNDLDQAVPQAMEMGIPSMGTSAIEGERPDLIKWYKTLNRAMPDADVEKVVEGILEPYRKQLVEPKKAKGK